jgi:hypothetical protein
MVVEKKVRKLFHRGDLAGDGRRRRSRLVSSEFLSLGHRL